MKDPEAPSTKPLFIKLAWVVFISFILTAFFELVKHALDGDTSIWQSDLITIVFCILTAVTVFFFVIRKSEKINRQLTSEINRRKEVEKVLSLSEKELRTVTSHVAEGIYVFDKEGHLTFMNSEAERLFGWTIEELNKKGPHDLVHYLKPDGTPLPFTECRMHSVTNTGDRYASADEVFVRKDGTVFPVSVISAPIIEEGEVIASVTAFRDITDLKKIEKEKEMLITGLREALFTIRTLQGILPICASCKRIRDDKGSWTQIESYISKHSEAEFTHSICPECAEKLYPEYQRKK